MSIIQGQAGLPENERGDTQGALYVNMSTGAPIAPAASPPAATVANTDTPYIFAAQCRTGRIQNKTNANLYYELDGATAVSLGSPVIGPDYTEWINVPFTTIHLLTTAIQNINGTADSNIVVKGWA